jgi:hypothetical protein
VSRGPSLKRTVETLVDIARRSHATSFTVKMPDGTEVHWNPTDTVTADRPQTDNAPNEIDMILEHRKKTRREAKP